LKILVTGAKGMLGSDLLPLLEQEHKVIGVDIDNYDLTSIEAIQKIQEVSPELVLHLAAYTDVDGCETNAELSYATNAIATRNVSLACQKMRAAMVYISTDYVFDGEKKGPYFEFDSPNPINVYGQTKLAGEYFVSHLLNRFYIVRTAWLYGRKGRNFVDTILKHAQKKEELRVVDDQVGSPTYTKDLAKALVKLIRSNLFGIYHLTNSGSCSWHEFAKAILKLAGLETKVIPTKSEQYVRPARRPKNSVLSNFCWLQAFKEPLRPWEEALKDYLRESGRFV